MSRTWPSFAYALPATYGISSLRGSQAISGSTLEMSSGLHSYSGFTEPYLSTSCSTTEFTMSRKSVSWMALSARKSDLALIRRKTGFPPFSRLGMPQMYHGIRTVPVSTSMA